jgi:hypothetical protein
MKNTRLFVLIGSIVVVLLVSFFIFRPNDVEEIVGGQRDEHGCLIGAGYSFDSEVGACIRDWELNENTKRAAKSAVENYGFSATVNSVEVARCPGCFTVELQRNDTQEVVSVIIENWEAQKVSISMTPQECQEKGGRSVNTVGVEGEVCSLDEREVGDVVGFISPNVCCVSVE